MKHFTLLNHLWRKALSALVLFVASAAAFALDFGPTPTTFKTDDLNGKYDVTFSLIAQSGFSTYLDSPEGFTLVDASGAKVPYAFVIPEMTASNTLTLTVSNVENAAAGTYTIKVPAGVFYYGFPDWHLDTNDAFDVTLNLNNGSEPVDPGTEEVDPGTEEVDPGTDPGVVTFSLDDHKSDTSLYFHDGDIVESNGAGVMLKFDRVAADGEKYTTCYKSNGGFVQFKDCQFTISAPAGNNIKKIVFVDGAPLSTTYDLDNLEAFGYNEGTWTGDAQSVTFNTKEIQYAIYDYDDDDNEYITGYTTVVTGARVKKIYVTLDIVPDGIESIASKTENRDVFDLAGRRVNAAAQKGVMIIGGKKVIR